MSMNWPVATIPTAPAATIPATAVFIPLRWQHHGDLRIVINDGDVLASADDILALAELDGDTIAEGDPHPALSVHPTIRPTDTWARRTDGALIAMYRLADAVAVLEHTPTHQTHELLAWMRDQLPLVMADDVLDRAVRLETFLHAWTVGQAAHILDRDPSVSIGRTSLFRHLEHIGWVHRGISGGHWEPTSTATRDGLLTIRDVLIRHRTRITEAYPQIYVTPAGLDQLRRTLHAQHPGAATEPPAPEMLPIPEN